MSFFGSRQICVLNKEFNKILREPSDFSPLGFTDAIFRY